MVVGVLGRGEYQRLHDSVASLFPKQFAVANAGVRESRHKQPKPQTPDPKP